MQGVSERSELAPCNHNNYYVLLLGVVVLHAQGHPTLNSISLNVYGDIYNRGTSCVAAVSVEASILGHHMHAQCFYHDHFHGLIH